MESDKLLTTNNILFFSLILSLFSFTFILNACLFCKTYSIQLHAIFNIQSSRQHNHTHFLTAVGHVRRCAWDVVSLWAWHDCSVYLIWGGSSSGCVCVCVRPLLQCPAMRILLISALFHPLSFAPWRHWHYWLLLRWSTSADYPSVLHLGHMSAQHRF